MTVPVIKLANLTALAVVNLGAILNSLSHQRIRHLSGNGLRQSFAVTITASIEVSPLAATQPLGKCFLVAE